MKPFFLYYFRFFRLVLILFVCGELHANVKKLNEVYASFLKEYVIKNRVNYKKMSKDKTKVQELEKLFRNINLKSLDSLQEKAFWINAYNLSAMKGISYRYPVFSPKQVSGFFTRVKHDVGGRSVSLDELEHKILLGKERDPRLHFALVCVAKGCPPIRNKPYTKNNLEKSLNDQARKTINDPYFILVDSKKKNIAVSELFRWFLHDFTKESPNLIAYLNRYSEKKIPSDFEVVWKTYDWTLNDSSAITKRHTYFDSSSLISKGNFEFKTYNQVYTENQFFNASFSRTAKEEGRGTYFTSITGFYYGIGDRWNLGLDLFFKSVRIDPERGSPFHVFNFQSNQNAHFGLTSAAPKVKFVPFLSLSRLAMQAVLLIPTGSDFQGNKSGRPFLEYDAWQLWYEVYYDHYFGENFSIFTAVGVFPRFGWMGNSFTIGGYLKVFYQYFFNRIITFYAVTEILGVSLSGGLGTKFLINRLFEIDLLVTHSLIGRNASVGTTYNLGLRYAY